MYGLGLGDAPPSQWSLALCFPSAPLLPHSFEHTGQVKVTRETGWA